MPAPRRGAVPVSLLKYAVALAALFTVLAVQMPAQTSTTPTPLSFFKNYFITGDYAVRGVSLWREGVDGVATAQIPTLRSGGVPDNSDIVAAFLYVQTAESVDGSGIDHAKFLGYDLGEFTGPDGDPLGPFAKPLVAWENAPTPCWSVNVPGGGRKLMTYRVDVLRFLPIAADGKYNLDSTFEIKVPDAGRLFGDDDEGCRETRQTPLPRALGASLLVVYRDPTKPFSAIVIYDGAYTKRAFAKMVQPLSGFYQASDTSPAAKMTHIVGDGRPRLFEQVLLDHQLIARNPYVGAEGTVWDNPTFHNLPLAGGAASTEVTVNRLGFLSDCVTFSAMVLRTTVQDSDGDGLLDVWEKPQNPPLVDPLGNQLPNLAAMGASPVHKDLFGEIAYMYAAEGTTYGGMAKPAHSHLPAQDALNMAAESFDKAPIVNPDGTKGIKVHFDIGGNYQPPFVDPATGLAYPSLPSDCQANWQPRCAIIPVGLARGGKNISETRACPNPDDPVSGQPIECGSNPIPGQYPLYPGTVGWKTGFQMLRDAVLVDSTGMAFDYARKDMFHYVLFAHSVGIPKAACQTELPNGDLLSDFDCQENNPGFHVPRTNSGIADFPGGDVLITLGAFEDDFTRPIGTPFMQGSTLMHELGHNFELTHAGVASLDPTVEREPNCKPNYHSVMNYLYQLRGLPDASGEVQMNFSDRSVSGVNESGLFDVPLFGAPPLYRSGWYAPLAGSYLDGIANAASKHCDGSGVAAGEVPMVRVDAAGVGDAIDWNANGVLDDSVAFHQDVNFDGKPDDFEPGSNDWANLRLNQLGSRRNVGGYYVIPPPDQMYAVGPMSLDVGRGDIGRGDIGRGDIGRGDIGRGDIGRGDIGTVVGRGDIGRGDIGRGDIGRGDIGRGDIGVSEGRGDIGRGDIGRGAFGGGDLDVGGPGEPIGDIDLETAKAVAGNAPSPANELTACLTISAGLDYPICATGDAIGDLPVRLDWQAPHLDQATSYSIYRFAYNPEAVFPPAILPMNLLDTLYVGDGYPPPTTFIDNTAAPGQYFAYFVIAHFADESSSGISNFARIATPAASGSVQGVLVDSTGAPLPGVLVSIRNDSTGWTPPSVTTGTGGTFMLPNLPAGSYTFTQPAGVTRSFVLAGGEALNLGFVVVSAPPGASARITGVNLANTTLAIGGSAVPYTASLVNETAAILSVVYVQGYIDQGSASRGANGATVICGGTPEGNLPVGSCTFNWTLAASNEAGGSGTLVPGPATARFELRRYANATDSLLDTLTLPVTLVATPATATGDLTYNSKPNAPLTYVGSWTQGVAQTFELTVDLVAKTTSLSIDGTTAAVNVPFYQVEADAFNTVGVELGTTGTQRFAWDDITVETAAVPSPGLTFAGNFNSDTIGASPSISPTGGTWTISETAGTVQVQTASGNLGDKPVELTQNGGTNSVSIHGVLSPTLTTGVWKIRWKSLMAAPGNQGPFVAIAIRSGSLLVAGVEYR